jgi:hypothetical protein
MTMDNHACIKLKSTPLMVRGEFYLSVTDGSSRLSRKVCS